MKIWAAYIFFIYVVFLNNPAAAQHSHIISNDTVEVSLLAKYDSVGTLHRKVFGENYRKEYAYKTKIPVIYISRINGGLKPIQRGGGFQTRSLRLEDQQGREWSLRSIEKYPEILLPRMLRETFLKDVLKDNMSAQHPFSALIVPVLAKAIGAPHATPVIGWVFPDTALGEFAKEFANTVCLLEEREPGGKSDNTAKMHRKLIENNEIGTDKELYLKLKCLDVLIGDWDRHDDQWRWILVKDGSGTNYVPVPRDRDQALFRSDGLLQRYTQSSWLLPMMQGFERDIRDINWFLWEGREINSKWLSEIDESSWNRIVDEFCKAMTDDLLEQALRKLPEPGYSIRHHALLEQLKRRRSQMPKMMNKYYHFFNRIVDIELSDKSESVKIDDAGKAGLSVLVEKIVQNTKQKKQLYHRTFDPLTTKEIRLYLHNGSDSLTIKNKKSKILIRIISGENQKHFYVENAARRIRLYAKPEGIIFSGEDVVKLKAHLSKDTSNIAYLPKDMYKRHFIYPNFGLNNDDGLSIGLGIKLTNPGFRKSPYGNSQSFSGLYAAGTSAFKFNYTGEWLNVFAKTDIVIHAQALAPTNVQNFFGFGNQTYFKEGENNLSYYRARFNLYELNPSLRWRIKKSAFSAGLLFQSYSYRSKDNTGRFISVSNQLHSPDSATISQNKLFTGATVRYLLNTRNSESIPTKGLMLDLKLVGYKGLNQYSSSFGQITSSISFYQKIDSAARVVFADRIGGGFTIGKSAFYQAQFIGGQGNLLGYRLFRFAGEHSVYNNFETRIKLTDFINYVVPGQIGVLGLYDLGRVWKRGEQSDVWHHGFGAGLYFAPASFSVFRLVAGYSREGWYPYFAMGFRY